MLKPHARILGNAIINDKIIARKQVRQYLLANIIIATASDDRHEIAPDTNVIVNCFSAANTKMTNINM